MRTLLIASLFPASRCRALNRQKLHDGAPPPETGVWYLPRIRVPQNHMARKIGVLEAHQCLTDQPIRKVKLSVANYLVRQLLARRLSRSLIQMVRVKAQDAIREIRAWWDGVLGTGNALPFSKPTDPGHHYSYPIPHAGDVGVWRHYRRQVEVSVRRGARVIAQMA